MKGFLMTLEVAEKFYKRCAEKEAVTLEERLKIMHELIHEENIRIMNEKQLKEELIDKKALVIKKSLRKGKL